MMLNTLSTTRWLLFPSLTNDPKAHVSPLGNMNLHPRVRTPNREPASLPDDVITLSGWQAFNPKMRMDLGVLDMWLLLTLTYRTDLKAQSIPPRQVHIKECIVNPISNCI